MTTITLPRALIEQALEVINDTAYGAPVFRQEVRDTITTLRAALAQPDPQDPELSAALGWPGGISDPVLDRKVLLQQVAALRAALAQQAEPVQEPVAWSGYDLDGMVEAFSRVVEAHYQRANPFQNPIDMDAQMALRVLRGFIPAMKAYAAPPQRKPLTEEVAALTAQRDALLEALKELMVAADGVNAGPQTWLTRARAAIKAAEENT